MNLLALDRGEERDRALQYDMIAAGAYNIDDSYHKPVAGNA